MKLKFIGFLILTFLIFTIGVGSWGLTESSEARYAEISKEMFEAKNYLEPTLLGIKHFHKPPITYYITELGYKLFGIGEFGARFFLQIALIFQLLFIYLIAKLLFKDDKKAIVASLIYISFPIVIISVRNLTTDAYLNTFILGTLYFWIHFRNSQKPIYLYLFYLFLGLVFETKGPVGLIIPLTFIITTKITQKEKILGSIHQYLGFLLFLIISSSWFILLAYSNENLLSYLFNHQLVDRVAVDNFHRGKPFYYYLPYVPLLGFPLLFLLFEQFRMRFMLIIKEKSIEFSLIISVLIFLIILSVSTSKLILYALPLYSIIALIIGNNYFSFSEK